jgi:hypothetical protein
MSADQILQAANGSSNVAWPIPASSPKRMLRTSVPSVTSCSTPRANIFGEPGRQGSRINALEAGLARVDEHTRD